MIKKSDLLTDEIKDTISAINIFRKPDVPANEDYNSYLDDIILGDIERAKYDKPKS